MNIELEFLREMDRKTPIHKNNIKRLFEMEKDLFREMVLLAEKSSHWPENEIKPSKGKKKIVAPDEAVKGQNRG